MSRLMGALIVLLCLLLPLLCHLEHTEASEKMPALLAKARSISSAYVVQNDTDYCTTNKFRFARATCYANFGRVSVYCYDAGSGPTCSIDGDE